MGHRAGPQDLDRGAGRCGHHSRYLWAELWQKPRKGLTVAREAPRTDQGIGTSFPGPWLPLPLGVHCPGPAGQAVPSPRAMGSLQPEGGTLSGKMCTSTLLLQGAPPSWVRCPVH